jgi:hypothetical protein
MWWGPQSDLTDEVEQCSRRVLEVFGKAIYKQAIIRAAAIGKQTPNDPWAMNLALRDELKRLLGPH